MLVDSIVLWHLTTCVERYESAKVFTVLNVVV